MADDDLNFFAAPPAVETVDDDEPAPIILGDAPPPVDDGYAAFGADAGYASMGDAVIPGSDGAAFLGDVNEADAFAAPPADNAFVMPADDAFAAPPADDYDAFGAPPAEDAPIVLGGPPPSDEDVANMGPSPMQKWNEEWTETLKNRKDEENQTKADMLENSRTEMEAFQEERNKKRDARMAKNREDEQLKLEAITEDLENDTSWQRCCKMIELQHDSTEKAQDVKRMRDTLIALKNGQGKALELSQ